MGRRPPRGAPRGLRPVRGVGRSPVRGQHPGPARPQLDPPAARLPAAAVAAPLSGAGVRRRAHGGRPAVAGRGERRSGGPHRSGVHAGLDRGARRVLFAGRIRESAACRRRGRTRRRGLDRGRSGTPAGGRHRPERHGPRLVHARRRLGPRLRVAGARDAGERARAGARAACARGGRRGARPHRSRAPRRRGPQPQRRRGPGAGGRPRARGRPALGARSARRDRLHGPPGAGRDAAARGHAATGRRARPRSPTRSRAARAPARSGSRGRPARRAGRRRIATDLPPGVDLSAYRIVQEALTNTLKHAGPARARVVLRFAEHSMELEITDDGRAPTREAGGHGLAGMTERVALYGGELETGTSNGRGFRVLARLPL